MHGQLARSEAVSWGSWARVGWCWGRAGGRKYRPDGFRCSWLREANVGQGSAANQTVPSDEAVAPRYGHFGVFRAAL